MRDQRDAQSERDRLEGMYGAMSEGELLGLQATVGDLTEVAQEALASEMRRRGMEAPVPEDAQAEDGGGPGWRMLHVFSQTFEAQAAFRLMEREGIEFAVVDRTVDENGNLVAGPAVQLGLMVRGEDRARAVAVLRREAGLFPEEVMDAGGDEEETAEESGDDWRVVGDFEDGGEMWKAEGMLRGQGIAFNVVTGEMAGGEAGSIEVREADLDRALEVLETLLAEEGA